MDQYTHVTKRGYGSRIWGSIKGIFKGKRSMHRLNSNIVIKIVLVGLAGLFLSGCGIGTCTIDCTSKEYGNRSVHGPYDNYTKAECEEKIEYTETILTDCSWEWEAY